MSESRIIAVVGATGAQGGGLARAILSHPEAGFKLRALTRNPDSEKGKALASAGAEVVAADLDDVESLKAAFKGAYGAFCLTNYWEHFSPEKEVQQAANMAEAARAEGVQHVIWSTLEDTRNWVPLESDQMPTLLEKYKVPHFDAKGEADALFDGLPVTLLLTSFYWENFIHFGAGPQPGPDGQLGITFPLDDKKMPGIGVEDIGKTAFAIFQRGPEFIGKKVGISGGHVSGQEMADGLSKVLGKTIRYNSVPPDVYRSFGFPGADDLGNMFQFKRDFEDYYRGVRSVEFTRSLNPEVQSYEQWAEANAAAIEGAIPKP
jgi:uncharacterized protein YbjT (DUF2867 family)